MIVEVNNLVKRYKELIALDHFNMEVEEGEIIGLLDLMVAARLLP